MSDSTRFNFNPMTASMGPLILEDGDYTFKIEDASAFKRDSTNPTSGETKEVLGVMVRLNVIEAPEEYKNVIGKSILSNFSMTTDSMQSIIMSFLAASYGYTQRQEEEFKQFASEYQWGIDWDQKILPSGWTELKGRTVFARVIKKPNPNDATQINNNFRWRPAGS